jgi:hypothetical protein|nr:MAG TPA: Head Tail Connector Protein [Caudoviricetes sp.]
METLLTLKLLLGIEDGKQDGLLSFLISDTENMILGYCRIEVMPRQLESLVPIIAADLYRAKGYGQEAAPEDVKSISEGSRSISYERVRPDDNVLMNYYKRLDPFKNRKGRVPSEIKSV